MERILDKNKIILIVYVGLKGESSPSEILYNVEKSLRNKFDDSIFLAIVPDYQNYFSMRIECINPVLLDDEQYKKVEEKIKEFEEKIKGLSNEKK